ncbi:MAG: hypothetical protein ACREA9_05080 [Pyrinomonadaceae bacterium]
MVHWIGNVDFRNYKDKEEIKEALLQSDQKVGGASQIWWFTHEMKPGEIVVANEGRSAVVGIGKLLSDYISPEDSDNPSTDADFRHARRVEWVITDRAEFPANFFPQKTVNKIDASQWIAIKEAYLKDRPELGEAFERLEGTAQSPSAALEDSEVSQIVRNLIAQTKHTRNIILYGPPGTGKTYVALRFIKAFLGSQLRPTASAEERRVRLLQRLKWYQALALTMSLSTGRGSFKVAELRNDSVMKDYLQLKKVNQANNSIWFHLQTHTSPESTTVTKKVATNLFFLRRTQIPAGL